MHGHLGLVVTARISGTARSSGAGTFSAGGDC